MPDHSFTPEDRRAHVLDKALELTRLEPQKQRTAEEIVEVARVFEEYLKGDQESAPST